jgi:hypothetical protein
MLPRILILAMLVWSSQLTATTKNMLHTLPQGRSRWISVTVEDMNKLSGSSSTLTSTLT